MQRYSYYILDNDDKCNINTKELSKDEAIAVRNEDILKKDNLVTETEERLKN